MILKPAQFKYLMTITWHGQNKKQEISKSCNNKIEKHC